MLTRAQRSSRPLVTLAALLVGVVLILTGFVPLQVAGGVFILGALFAPLLALSPSPRLPEDDVAPKPKTGTSSRRAGTRRPTHSARGR